MTIAARSLEVQMREQIYPSAFADTFGLSVSVSLVPFQTLFRVSMKFLQFTARDSDVENSGKLCKWLLSLKIDFKSSTTC